MLARDSPILTGGLHDGPYPGRERLAAGTAKSRSADDIRRGYFKLVVGSHVIFYRKGASDVIEVVRILHQQMDFDRHL